MPWREVIFTDTGVVYPASWGMNTQHRSKSESMGQMEPTDTASMPATPGKEKMDMTSFEHALKIFANDCDYTPEDGSPATMLIATQDLISRRDAEKESPSILCTNEHAAAYRDVAIHTDAQPEPLLRRSSPACSERQPRKGCRSP